MASTIFGTLEQNAANLSSFSRQSLSIAAKLGQGTAHISCACENDGVSYRSREILFSTQPDMNILVIFHGPRLQPGPEERV